MSKPKDSPQLYRKGVHYSPELERAIVGICIIEPTAISRVYSFLKPDMFYLDMYRDMFDTLHHMYLNSIPIDSWTLLDQLTRIKGRPDMRNEIIQTMHSVVSSAHLEYHSFIVKNMWLEREIIKLTTAGTEPDHDTRKKITGIQDRLQELQQTSQQNDWADMSELMVKLYQHQDKMRETKGMGLACGVWDLDHQNGGFHPGQSIIIAARPSVGKSAFAGGIALHMARNGHKVGIISLEMSNEEIAARLAAIDTHTDFNVLFRGLYRDQQQTEAVYRKIADSTSMLPIFVSDKTSVDIVNIKAKAYKLRNTHGIDCLMIDYLQLIDVPNHKNRTREQEVSAISRQCKILAKEMNIPVVLLCQLNRESTKRTGKDRYPRLSDLRESGSLEQDADVVMFLHRDWMVDITQDENGQSTEKQADIVVRKWRNGMNNFTIPLDFEPRRMLFTRRREYDIQSINTGEDDTEPF